MRLIGIEDARKHIDEAEVVFDKSFDRLLSIKHADENCPDAILHFQSDLAECLYALMCFYQELVAEKKKLIDLKSQYDESVFSANMKKNQELTKMIREVINIGKSLGDAFAWLFYYKNSVELLEHQRHESTGLFTSKIGGLGEVEFIKEFQQIEGLYVVYHGITTILRIGDLSLVDLKHGVVAIGELKSKLDGDNLTVQALFTSKVKLGDNWVQKGEDHFECIVDQSRKDKYKKQLQRQEALLRPVAPGVHSEKELDNEHGLLDEFVHGKTWTKNADQTLILIDAFHSDRKLSSILLDMDTLEEMSDEITENLQSIFQPVSEYNMSCVSMIDGRMHYSRVPLFWWGINDSICREIYLHKRVIESVFNPAKLIQHYISDGFHVVQIQGENGTVLEKIEGGRQISIVQFDLFYDLVLHELMKPAAVMEIIDAVIKELRSGKYAAPIRMDIVIHQRLWKL